MKEKTSSQTNHDSLFLHTKTVDGSVKPSFSFNEDKLLQEKKYYLDLALSYMEHVLEYVKYSNSLQKILRKLQHLCEKHMIQDPDSTIKFSDLHELIRRITKDELDM